MSDPVENFLRKLAESEQRAVLACLLDTLKAPERNVLRHRFPVQYARMFERWLEVKGPNLDMTVDSSGEVIINN